ncbi:hypothetical protein ABBQ38_000770 [Trebouxia sp. C0009 RCD-2024]
MQPGKGIGTPICTPFPQECSHLKRVSMNIRNSSGDNVSPWMVPLSTAIGFVSAKYNLILVTASVYRAEVHVHDT